MPERLTNEIAYRYRRYYVDGEETYTSLDDALYSAWSNHEFGEAYGIDIIHKKTGEVLLDNEDMMRLADMLYRRDYGRDYGECRG